MDSEGIELGDGCLDDSSNWLELDNWSTEGAENSKVNETRAQNASADADAAGFEFVGNVTGTCVAVVESIEVNESLRLEVLEGGAPSLSATGDGQMGAEVSKDGPVEDVEALKIGGDPVLGSGVVDDADCSVVEITDDEAEELKVGDDPLLDETPLDGVMDESFGTELLDLDVSKGVLGTTLLGGEEVAEQSADTSIPEADSVAEQVVKPESLNEKVEASPVLNESNVKTADESSDIILIEDDDDDIDEQDIKDKEVPMETNRENEVVGDVIDLDRSYDEANDSKESHCTIEEMDRLFNELDDELEVKPKLSIQEHRQNVESAKAPLPRRPTSQRTRAFCARIMEQTPEQLRKKMSYFEKKKKLYTHLQSHIRNILKSKTGRDEGDVNKVICLDQSDDDDDDYNSVKSFCSVDSFEQLFADLDNKLFNSDHNHQTETVSKAKPADSAQSYIPKTHASVDGKNYKPTAAELKTDHRREKRKRQKFRKKLNKEEAFGMTAPAQRQPYFVDVVGDPFLMRNGENTHGQRKRRRTQPPPTVWSGRGAPMQPYRSQFSYGGVYR